MTDGFWAAVDAQLVELRTAKSADDVLRILGKSPDSSGDAFFAGSGGDESVMGALQDAGWHVVWAAASYNYVMQSPSGDLVTYVEGDVYRGDTAMRGN